MIGLKFEIPNEYGHFLNDIFKNIDTKKYEWRLSNEEIIIENEIADFKKDYTDSQIKSELFSKESYIIFLTLQLFIKGKKRIRIESCEEYVNNNCILLLNIVDNIFVEIYCKDIDILERIKNNAISNKFKNITSIFSD